MSVKVRTADRTIDVLFCFLELGPEVRVTDVVERVKLDKATTSRLLSTLAARGLVAKNPVTGRYRLGPAIFALSAAAPGSNLAHLAIPALTWLRDASGESATIDVLVGDSRVCIAQVESKHDLRRVIEVGRPFPAYAGAAGKTLLAHLADEARNALLERVRLASLTPNTIIDRAALSRQLEKIRREGFAVAVAERVPGVAAAAVPVRGPHDDVVAALTVSMPSSRYESKRVDEYVRWLRAASAQISVVLGRGITKDARKKRMVEEEST